MSSTQSFGLIAPPTSSREGAAAKVSEEILSNVPLVNVKKVLIVGSGGLSIGQAGEFDYSGSQAIKALRESGIKTILVNPNIATIQTSHTLADKVYFLPVTCEYVSNILERERPDGILLTFGGQTALNCGIELDRSGILERLNIKVLGTPIKTLITSEDRDLFVKALNEIDVPVAQSTAVDTVEEALKAASEIGYPVIVRCAFALGGLGSGFADNEQELRTLATKSLTLVPQLLVERSMKGWKEVEYEVMRDSANNCITVCNMENFDPLGVHTGESIVVAPSQTLSDEEYHMLRTAAIKIIRHLGVVGECNVQYALNPKSLEFKVIEVNARLSRSSALASKATGYPLAFIAAKIALGHTLPSLQNAVTKTTTACFEPSLDYIVTKIPRWDLSKFQYVDRHIGSAMKSVGEVMAVGRTFEESMQKAIRQVDPSFSGFDGLPTPFEDVDDVLANPTDRRLFALGQVMLNKDKAVRDRYTVDHLNKLTNIDKWFLHKLQKIANIHLSLGELSIERLPVDLLKNAKKTGFSDAKIAKLIGAEELAVRALRKENAIVPHVKRIDTVAAEFPAHTNYLYTTYNAATNDVSFDEHGTMVLGSGVYRIGSSVEFDWCGVSCSRALRAQGEKTVMVNYNPETVSTDFDECDRLYFEELSFERVMDIAELEGAKGIVVSVGGQLPQNIALKLHDVKMNVLGTSPLMIDAAEDRFQFSKILDKVGVDQPAWKELTSVEAAFAFAEDVGYPVLVRPSYVLSGAAMNVAYTPDALKHNLTDATNVSPLHPVVITKFIENAQEIDVDCVASKGAVLVHAVSEHVENAGVHSGDASLILPPRDLSPQTMSRLKDIADKVAGAFEITGPFNMQIIKQDIPGQEEPLLKVIECNLRASRSFPFVSKVLGVNFIDVATRALAGKNVPEPIDLMAKEYGYQAVKVPQFSWTRLQGADPFLGVEMASTGEVACFGKDKYQAFWAAIQSTQNFRIPSRGAGVLIGGDQVTDKKDYVHIAQTFHNELGHPIFVPTEQDKLFLEKEAGVSSVCLPIAACAEDKRVLNKHFKDNNIDFVIHLAKIRAPDQLDEGYVCRRAAVDFGIPLINDSKVAVLFADACVRHRTDEPRTAEKIPDEVKCWSEFVDAKI
ncbi:large subunit of carbamoyl-phosphate synthase [Gilbertella persicaria]|uniref:Ammonium-dependent carbamoyl phosphate synthetase n=1 Tax=Rhizopus stolonifer TaxID=4846 RepID=A0A367KJ00_RHIST|nr:large subunit of carbamoyl-phosphate synthase [Gilbertella persicaria]KAI8069094.1 large subunit of carbamoyl-phosphate synthase [Gilbertella persicaria]RCI02176.1 carbamoyl-phosphate synthase (glutamine-hydrolyzing) cpa2 [Rhizopus stolonifer]